jgi:hypothetical protein
VIASLKNTLKNVYLKNTHFHLMKHLPKTENLRTVLGKSVFLILLLVAVIAGSCKKKTGPAGPQGPAGPTGNANVKETTFTNQSFHYNSTFGEYEMHLSVPAITDAVQNTGAILVYLQPADTTYFIALPYNDQGDIRIGFTTSKAGVDLFANFNPPPANYKVVVIPSN